VNPTSFNHLLLNMYSLLTWRYKCWTRRKKKQKGTRM